MKKELHLQPALAHPELLARRCLQTLEVLPCQALFQVAAIEPDLADTAAMCESYDVSLSDSVNCVVIAAKRGSEVQYGAALVLATTKVDVNGVYRRHLGVRKASFAPMNVALELTAMEYGGITPFGLPDQWPILVDPQVIGLSRAIFGSGLRASKLFAPGKTALDLGGIEVIEGLGQPN